MDIVKLPQFINNYEEKTVKLLRRFFLAKNCFKTKKNHFLCLCIYNLIILITTKQQNQKKTKIYSLEDKEKKLTKNKI